MAKIKSITRKYYAGKVHDLTVKDTHAYNIDSLSVHNSAAGSLCLYVIGVTGVDPIKYGLLFERFLNPDRISPPDVDVDFDDSRRSEIIDYVTRKYGEDHCCKIGTYQALKARSIVRYVVKAMDLGGDWEIMERARLNNPDVKPEESKRSLSIACEIAEQVPEGPGVTIETTYKECPEFRMLVDKYSGLIDNLRNMEKVLGSSGVHASGYVVCKDPIVDHVPLRESKDQICCQFDGPEIEKLGLLKFDFLGLKNVTIMDKTVKMIKERHNIEIEVDKLEPNDKKVFELFNGEHPTMDTKGIFQFESWGMVKLLKEIHVDSFEDLAVATALYRPGPLGAGVHELYADYKHKRKPINALHPKLKEILSKTYGLICYQEDVMKVSRELAGFTRGQSDTLRKCVGKKDMTLLATQKDLFIQGCVKNGISESIATKIFEQIEYFGGYGFNLSHSVAYSLLSYANAYLKLYYPLEYMANLLTTEIGNDDKFNVYLEHAKRIGIVVRKANINKSGLAFSIEKGVSSLSNKPIEFLRTPFTAIKGIGEKTVKSIIDNQPFSSMDDFIFKINLNEVNVRVFGVLLDSGAMDEWGNPNDDVDTVRRKINDEYVIAKNEYRKEKARQQNEQKRIQKEKDKIENVFCGGNLFSSLCDVDSTEIKF